MKNVNRRIENRESWRVFLFAILYPLFAILAQPAATAGEWNGVNIIDLNGVSQTQWNATAIAYILEEEDTTPPELVSATVASDGVTLTLVFSEAVDCDALINWNATVNSWTVNSIGTGQGTLTYVSGGGTSTIVYNLSATAYHEDVITLDYSTDENRIKDLAGNNLGAITAFPVTNNVPDTTAPTIVSVTIEADGVTVTMVFSEEVTFIGSPDGIFFFTGTSASFDSLSSGDGTTTLVFALSHGTALASETITVTYTGSNEVADLANNPLATFSELPVTNNSTQ